MKFIEITLASGIENLGKGGIAIRTNAPATGTNGGALSYTVHNKTYEQIKEELSYWQKYKS